MSEVMSSEEVRAVDFDPFACEDRFEDDGGDQVPRRYDYNPNPISVPRDDNRPAIVRIGELLDRLGSQRKTCLGIIALCGEPRTFDEVRAEVERLQAGNASVFDAGRLCSLLERAGALERVTQDGTPREADAPAQIVEDGEGAAHYRAADEEPLYWLATQDGRMSVPAVDPEDEVAILIQEAADYLPIYQGILHQASAEGGVKAKTLIKAFDEEPIMQNPRRSCTIFVDHLREVDALEWRGAWFTTEFGVQALQQIDAVLDNSKQPIGGR